MTNLSDCLTTDSLSILQLTDLHILANHDTTLLGINTTYYFEAVLAMAFAQHRTFDLILLTGDLAQDAVIDSYQYILDKMNAFGIPCLCLPGNHDDPALMRQVFNTGLISCRKQLVLNDWQIISLNSQIPGSDGGRLAVVEMEFLEGCLRDFQDKHALIAVHHHCLKTNSVWMDTMIIENSDEFLAVIRKYPRVKLILNGHIHQLMDRTMGTVRVLGTPSTCFQFKPESREFGIDTTSPAYRLIQLHADGRLETQVFRLPEPLAGLQMDTAGY
ncbi:MAG: 3',5'-cyclic-AMP phosphodiesterase [Methylovulum sp.]|nr:3',5'-cyclic-AMP phosphodiesterase [Methylovulum sp.]